MFHLYLVTDADGSWPLLREEPLDESARPRGTAVVALLGRFEARETASAALALAREAICGRERRDDDPGGAARRWQWPRPEALPATRRSPRRSGRRQLPR
jgi:hypothetical protein